MSNEKTAESRGKTAHAETHSGTMGAQQKTAPNRVLEALKPGPHHPTVKESKMANPKHNRTAPATPRMGVAR